MFLLQKILRRENLSVRVITGVFFLIACMSAGYLVVFPHVLFTPILFFISLIGFCGLVIVAVKKSHPFDPFEPIWFFLLTAGWTLSYPVVMFLNGSYKFRFLVLNENEAELLVIQSTLLLVLAYLSAGLGYYNGKIGRRISFNLPKFSSSWSEERAWAVIIVVSIISVISYYWVLQRTGGFLVLLNSLGLRAELLAGNVYLQVLAQMIVLPLTLMVVTTRRPLRHPIFWVLLVGAVIINWSFGSRTNVFFWTIVPVLISFHYYHKRLSWRMFLFAGLVAVFVSTVMLQMRVPQRQSTALYELDNIATNLDWSAATGNFLDERSVFFDLQAWVLYHVPNSETPWYGKNYLQVLIAPIPRALWPDKPVGFTESGLLGRMVLGERFYGLPPDLPALFYLNFLLPGVLIGMFLVGLWHRAIYEYLGIVFV